MYDRDLPVLGLSGESALDSRPDLKVRLDHEFEVLSLVDEVSECHSDRRVDRGTESRDY